VLVGAQDSDVDGLKVVCLDAAAGGRLMRKRGVAQASGAKHAADDRCEPLPVGSIGKVAHEGKAERRGAAGAGGVSAWWTRGGAGFVVEE
jgi:hypothetical protein